MGDVRDTHEQRSLTEAPASERAARQEVLESGSGRPGRRRSTIAWLSGLVAFVVLLGVMEHHHSPAVHTARSVVPPPLPQLVPTPRCEGRGCDRSGAPSQAVVSAFTQDVPGSIVISEHTVSERVGGDLTVRRRLVHAVSGNVDMVVSIMRADLAAHHRRRPDDQLVRHGYVIDFGFVGYYPPSRAQLRALADDTRLVSVWS